MPVSQKLGRKGLKDRTDLLLPILFKGFHSLSFKVIFLLVHSSGPERLIRIQFQLSAKRQLTSGTSSDMLLLIHVKGTEGEQQKLLFSCSLTVAR